VTYIFEKNKKVGTHRKEGYYGLKIREGEKKNTAFRGRQKNKRVSGNLNRPGSFKIDLPASPHGAGREKARVRKGKKTKNVVNNGLTPGCRRVQRSNKKVGRIRKRRLRVRRCHEKITKEKEHRN